MVREGQIYKQINGVIFVIAGVIDSEFATKIYQDGYAVTFDLSREDDKSFVFYELLAEYPTWQEAVNSPEFNQ